jgi:hypothetical protein
MHMMSHGFVSSLNTPQYFLQYFTRHQPGNDYNTSSHTSLFTTLSVSASRPLCHVGRPVRSGAPLSLASNEVDIPQQQFVTSDYPASTTTTALMMANRSERFTSSMPNWLLPNRRSLPNCHSPARLPASTSIQTSFSNHDHIQPQRHPDTLQHDPEPPATAHHIALTAPSLALTSEYPVVCVAKRKAPDVAPRDEEQRGCHSRHVATTIKSIGGKEWASGGSMIRIDESEGAKIMMEATTALKNPTRRVTVSGGEIRSKRTRAAAIDSDGESSCFLIPLYVVLIISRGTDTEPRLSWRRKVGGVPPPVAQLGPLMLDDTSDNDVPLASQLPPLSRGLRQRRVLSVEKLQSKMKGKGKAKADRFDSIDLDVSREDTSLGGSRFSDYKVLQRNS